MNGTSRGTMRRIESKNVPAETRRMLRERLRRFLPVDSGLKGPLEQVIQPLVSDKEIVDLYLHLVLVPGNDITQARERYERASQARTHEAPSVLSREESLLAQLGGLEGNESNATERNASEEQYGGNLSVPLTVSVQSFASSPSLEGLAPTPLFDELVERGWIRISWGRLSVPNDIRMAIHSSADANGIALKRLIESLGRKAFKLREGFTPSGKLGEIANHVLTEQLSPGEIVCISRSWIAARLWDTRLNDATDRDAEDAEQRISRWIDRWQLLNFPSFAMSNLLEPASFDEFVEAAMNVLKTPSTSPAWDEFRKAAGVPTALLYPHRGAAESIVSLVPETTVDRMRWMASTEIEGTFYEYLDSRGSSLLGVLLNELQEAPWAPRRLAPRLMELVVERPVLLQQLVMRVRQAPILLADMLMTPSTCALACSLIASWDFSDGGWSRNFQAHANHTTELLAFEDAIALLGGHLDAGLVHANELAALYLHIYKLASNPRQSSQRYDVLSLLRQELTSTVSTVQDAVVVSLVASAATSSHPMTAFCAALDLASENGCIDRIDPSEIVSVYLDILLPRGERLGHRQLELKSAQSFVALALRCDQDLLNRFLNAIDVPARLKLVSTLPDQEHSFLDKLVCGIRLHVRVLSRSIASWPTEVPNELVDALSRAVRAGATNSQDRGRVDAFVPGSGFGHAWAAEPPIALDLAAALRRLEGRSLQTLLTQLCQIEEPIVLGGIVANTPATINDQIKAHLSTLTPETSSAVWSLSVLQARVEALLNAGLPERAEVFIAAERDAETRGSVPGREISRLRARLRMLLLREEWTAIEAYTLPENMREPDKREASDTLLFYRGIAELKKANGNPATAEAIFSALIQRNCNITSYAINLFASRVCRLLGSNTLGLLSGEALIQARRYLTEVQRETRPLIQHSAPDLRVLDGNRAMLLLAINQPRECLEVLLELRETNFDAQTEGFRALAMARIGSTREALALLTQAERVFGRSDFLSAIRENIDTHRPYATAPNLSLNDDPVPGIRQAFASFTRLSHVEQAEVLQSRGSLGLYLIEEVRGACASLVALASMMRELGMVRHENDISGVLKQILRSRLLLAQWAVEDQPPGGFSRTGGVGERDIVVSKGTATLAVLEALIVDSVEAGNLTSHFNKLLGYDTCRYFFHITYARRSNCAGILAHLRAACREPPSGISFLNFEPLSDFDSMPVGFTAHYEIDSRSIAVTFLALDLGQSTQRGAAAAQ